MTTFIWIRDNDIPLLLMVKDGINYKNREKWNKKATVKTKTCPSGGNRYYPYDLVADVMVIMVPPPGRSDSGPPNNQYGASFNSFSSSESKRRCRGDWCTQQHDQFEQSKTAMNNLPIDLLHHHQQKQNDTTCALQVIHQSHRYHANDSLNDTIPTFDGKPVLWLDIKIRKYTCSN